MFDDDELCGRRLFLVVLLEHRGVFRRLGQRPVLLDGRWGNIDTIGF